MYYKQDIFKLTLNLQIPSIHQNEESLGYQIYEHNVITGNMNILYYDELTYEGGKYKEPEISYENLKNCTYIQQDGNIVEYYGSSAGKILYVEVADFYHYMGNNSTNKFYTPSFYAQVLLDPCQDIGTPNSTMSLILAGTGTIGLDNSNNKKAILFNGIVSGIFGDDQTYEYETVSPIRVASSTGPYVKSVDNNYSVSHKTAITGSWVASYVKTIDF